MFFHSTYQIYDIVFVLHYKIIQTDGKLTVVVYLKFQTNLEL